MSTAHRDTEGAEVLECRETPGRRLALALGASAAVVLAAPFVGGIRGAIQSAFPEHYRSIVISVVAGAVVLAIVAAASRIRDRRRLRYGLLGLSLALGAAYASATSSGNAEVDAVERFHFVEYGVLALLYQRVWRARGGVSTVVMPILAGILVGTADEWFQWFVPFRVGELRDVLLNGVALVCGVLFGTALAPPARLSVAGDPESKVLLARTTILTIAAAAAFFHTVHLGHEVRLGGSSRFLSRFSAEQLAAAARDRAARWGGQPPVERPLSREDHYLAEARWHIQGRNEAAAAGDIRTAWHEERILESFYGPVLDALPSDRWPPEQRADAEARAGADAAPFSSSAHAHPIYPWRPAGFWAAVALVVAAVAPAARVPGGSARSRAGQPA